MDIVDSQKQGAKLSAQAGPSRKRVLNALHHKQPDRVPIDLGSTIVTGITAPAYKNLLDHLGYSHLDVRFFDHEAQLAIVDDQIKDLFGVDTAGVKHGAPTRNTELARADDLHHPDAWGIWCRFSHETLTWFVVEGPLSGNITQQDIINYPFPDPTDEEWLSDIGPSIQQIRSQRDCAILLALPTNFILKSIEMRGYEDWLMDTAQNQGLITMLMDRILEVQLEICSRILDQFGDQIDIVVNFDDLAIQDRLMVSPRVYQKILAPRLKQVFDLVHSKTQASILYHTDGAVRQLLGSLIDLGIDAVNPVQISAQGMNDLDGLKKEFGPHLTFWGGVDTQHLLPNSSPEEVKTAVRRTINILSQDGGYVLNAVHNIQPDVPPANIVAMFEAALGID